MTLQHHKKTKHTSQHGHNGSFEVEDTKEPTEESEQVIQSGKEEKVEAEDDDRCIRNESKNAGCHSPEPHSEDIQMDDSDEKDESATSAVADELRDQDVSSPDRRIVVHSVRGAVCPDCDRDAKDADGIYCGRLCRQWVAHREALPFLECLTEAARQRLGPAPSSGDNPVSSSVPPSSNLSAVNTAKQEDKWVAPQKERPKSTSRPCLTSGRPRRAVSQQA